MSVKQLNTELDSLVSQGDMVTAVSKYFADKAVTMDHDGTQISSKAAQVAKMQTFLGGILAVNDIIHYGSAVETNVSFSEFTFDFDMKDGSKIFWHEIIRREWEGEKVISEQYFKI